MTSKTMIFTLPAELKNLLEEHHLRVGAPMAEILRRALVAYLKPIDKVKWQNVPCEQSEGRRHE